MGLLSNLRASEPTVEAAVPAYFTNITPNYWTDSYGVVTRERAMTIPAVARARNLVCGVIGSMPLQRWALSGNRRLDAIPMQYAPDPEVPKTVTMSWIVDSILFYGVAYVQVLETYATDGRVARFRWIENTRVTPEYDLSGKYITGYQVDAVKVPNDGVGSIKAFYGLDQGLLVRGGRTLITAIALEEAAKRAAEEPIPQTVLKDKGPNRTKDFLSGLMSGWASARQSRATAYLSGDFDLEVLGFNPKDQQLVEARQYHAAELARAMNLPAWFLNADIASMTYSNVEQERRSLIDFSLKPIMRAIEERLSMPDFLARDLELRFDLDDFLRGSSKEQMEVMTGYVAAGIMSEDEARAAIDLSPRGA